MIHQFRDKKQIAKKKKLIKNLILLGSFLVFIVLGIFAFSNNFTHYLGKPLWRIKTSAINGLESVGYIVRTKASVYKENENLLKENTDLKISMIDYQILKDENLKLKESLGRVPSGKNFILSSILTKPNYSPYDTIIIDIGLDSGITIGNRVYGDGDSMVPIGEISVVYKNTSLVTLYTNPGETTEAMIEGTNTSIDLVGRGGGNFEMTVPVDLPFVRGAFVYLPNLQSEIVAIAEDVISSPNDPVKKILLNSPINVQSLKWVFVSRE